MRNLSDAGGFERLPVVVFDCCTAGDSSFNPAQSYFSCRLILL